MKNCVLGAEQSLVEGEMFSFLFVVAVGLPCDKLLTHTHFVLIWNFAGINFLQENVVFVAVSVCGRKACESQI